MHFLKSWLQQHRYSVLFSLVLLAGAFLRFHHLQNIPPGLWYDEAFYAVHAMEFLQHGSKLIYFMRNEAQIGLFPEMLSWGFWWMGDTILAPRGVVAIIGMLTLIGCYYLTRLLFNHFFHSRFIALLATFLLASSYWHVNFSRLLFSTSLVPFFEVFSLLFTLIAFQKNQKLLAFIAGIVTSLGLYSYWQYYPFVVIPASISLYFIWHKRQAAMMVFTAFIVGGILTALPLLYAFVTYDMLARLQAIAITKPAEANANDNSILTFLHHSWLHIQMLFWEGDKNWRHNLSGQAQLAPLAMAGLLFCAWPRSVLKKNSLGASLLLLLAWIILAMLPASLSSNALPHASRAIGMVVPLQILAAWGLVSFCVHLPKTFSKPALVILIFCVALQYYATYEQYFIRFANAPEAREAFQIKDRNYLSYHFAWEANPEDAAKLTNGMPALHK